MISREVSITVKVTTIRDGTNGISMSVPDKILGQWQDSGAVSLVVTADNAVSICGKEGKHRYILSMPGTPVRAERLSETEAVITVQI
jgi:hypothetical protein